MDSESDPDIDLLLGISIAFAGQGMYFPINHMEEDANISDDMMESIWTMMGSRDLLIMQNKAFDLEQFRNVGHDFWHRPVADTMIMAHMIDENVMSKSLDYLHKHYTGKDGKNRSSLMQGFIDNMGWRFVPVVLMADYAQNDAVITEELFNILLPMYEEQYGSLYHVSNC